MVVEVLGSNVSRFFFGNRLYGKEAIKPLINHDRLVHAVTSTKGSSLASPEPTESSNYNPLNFGHSGNDHEQGAAFLTDSTSLLFTLSKFVKIKCLSSPIKPSLCGRSMLRCGAPNHPTRRDRSIGLPAAAKARHFAPADCAPTAFLRWATSTAFIEQKERKKW